MSPERTRAPDLTTEAPGVIFMRIPTRCECTPLARMTLDGGTLAGHSEHRGRLVASRLDITRESLAAVTDDGRATYKGTLASVETRDDGDSGREHRTAPESSASEGSFSLSSGIANKTQDASANHSDAWTPYQGRRTMSTNWTCELCGGDVDTLDAGTYRRVTGWERKAFGDSRRGGSDIVLRETQDVFAHSTCIASVRAGISVRQESLL